MNTTTNKILMLALVVTLSLPWGLMPENASAIDNYGYKNRQAGTMLVDGLVVRPIGIAATIIGGVTYVITLPFSALGGNIGEAQEALVNTPARFTFRRPLGEFDR